MFSKYSDIKWPMSKSSNCVVSNNWENKDNWWAYPKGTVCPLPRVHLKRDHWLSMLLGGRAHAKEALVLGFMP